MTDIITQPPQTDIGGAAQLLIEAHRSGRRLPALPAGLAPSSAADAYAIQDAVASALGRVGGWKVGSKSRWHEPTCAPIIASTIHAGPALVARPAEALRGVEAEIAVHIKKDLPPRPQCYTAREVAAALGAVMPALEVVDSRYLDMALQAPLALLADGLSNAGLVTGAARVGTLPTDTSQRQAAIFFDGRRMAGGAGGNAAGDLLRLLTWLANHVARRADGLRAGQVVTTGSWTGLLCAASQTRVTAVMQDLGTVELTFA